MSRFSRNQRRMPSLNTSSLPDLIFTVLFFFMIVTHMRSVPVKVAFQKPEGHQLTRLIKKSTVINIWIGLPLQNGNVVISQSDFVIQVNDRIIPMEHLASCLMAEKEKIDPEDEPSAYVSLKADRQVPMGVITDVKLALRQAGLLQVAYTAEERIFTF